MMVPCLLLTIFLLPFSNNYGPGGLFDKLVERREEYLALCCGVFLNDGPIFTCEGPCCFHFPTMIVPKDALLSLSKIYGGERDKHPPTCTHTHAHTHTHTHTHTRTTSRLLPPNFESESWYVCQEAVSCKLAIFRKSKKLMEVLTWADHVLGLERNFQNSLKMTVATRREKSVSERQYNQKSSRHWCQGLCHHCDQHF